LDIKKAMLVRLLRKQTSMPLEWIAKELTMGVRSSVSRADHHLTNELKENKKLQKICCMFSLFYSALFCC
jgi:hypothetical protein